MGPAIGDILPLAIGVALSPIPIIAIILMLFSKNARATSLGFLLGWFIGVAGIAAVVVLVANPVQQSTGEESSLLSIVVHLVLGLLLLVLAYRNWQKRPKPGDEVAMPKWMGGIETMTAGKALGMGALLSGVNPKNLALTLSAGTVIAGAALSTGQSVVVLAVYVIIACLSIAAPVALYLLMGDKASATLTEWKEWLTHNNATVMMLLCLVFGFVMLGKAIGPLVGN